MRLLTYLRSLHLFSYNRYVCHVHTLQCSSVLISILAQTYQGKNLYYQYVETQKLLKKKHKLLFQRQKWCVSARAGNNKYEISSSVSRSRKNDKSHKTFWGVLVRPLDVVVVLVVLVGVVVVVVALVVCFLPYCMLSLQGLVLSSVGEKRVDF